MPLAEGQMLLGTDFNCSHVTQHALPVVSWRISKLA